MYTFGPLVVVEPRTLRPVVGRVATVTDALTGDPVDTFDIDGQPVPVVTGSRGQIGQFRAGEDHALIRVEVTGGDPQFVPALEALTQAGEIAETITSGRLSEASLSSTIETESVAPARQAAMEYLSDQPSVVDAAAQAAIPAVSEAVSAGDWTLTKGRVPDAQAPRFEVHRKFESTAGDLFTSNTSLIMRVARQQSTSQEPPGYSMAEIVLHEEGDNAPIFQGDSNILRLISNRTLLNRRLEIDQGGLGRASLWSAHDPDRQYARLRHHNDGTPSLTLHGPRDAINPGELVLETHADHSHAFSIRRASTGQKLLLSYESQAHLISVLDGSTEVHRIRLHNNGSMDMPHTMLLVGQGIVVTREARAGASGTALFHSTDASSNAQQLAIRQYDAGHQALRADFNNELVGILRFEHTDKSLRLAAGTGLIHLLNAVDAYGDITHRAGFGTVLRSPNGTRYRLKVADGGALSTEAI